MATYSLSGSGTHALSAGTTGLQVTITTPSSIGGLGRSNPVAKYDQGLLRFDDGASAYWEPVPILGGPQFIPVPQNATSVGYALLGGAVVSVVEVINGTVFFSSSPSTLETLTDVVVASPSDAQVLIWHAATSKWINATPSSGPSPALTLIETTVVSGSPVASITFSAIPASYAHLRILHQIRASGSSNYQTLSLRFNADSGANYDWLLYDNGGAAGSTGQTSLAAAYVTGGLATAGYAGAGEITIPNYAGTVLFKNAIGNFNLERGLIRSGQHAGVWTSTAAISSIVLLLDANNIDVGSTVSLYGVS